MKIPTYKSVHKKAFHSNNLKNELNAIEMFIVYYSPVMSEKKELRKFMRDLQKVVDYVEKKAPFRYRYLDDEPV